MFSLCVFVMTLSVAPAELMPASSPEAPSAEKADKVEQLARAAKFFESGRYVEAALEFEDLRRNHSSRSDSSLLFNAAVSRDAAGHHAHAVAYLREYLAHKDLGADDRTQAEEQLAESLRKVQTLRVTIRLPLEGPRDARVVAVPLARGAADLRPELIFPVTVAGQVITLELDPGLWTIRAEGPAYRPVEQQVAVAVGTPALELRPELIRALGPATPPAPVVPPSVVETTTRALFLSGGIGAALGVGLVAGGAGKIRGPGVQQCSDPDLGECRRNFRNALFLRDIGTSVLGAGAGLVIGALVWRSPDPQRRKVAWISLAVLGGVGLVLGEVGVVRGVIPFNRDNTSQTGTLATWPDHWQEHRHTPVPALGATLRGLGLGLVVSAVTGLLVQRRYLGKALRVAPAAGPGHTGVVLSGSF